MFFRPNFYFRIFLVFLLGSCFGLWSQPVVVPNLNTPVFNSNSMNQTFSVADGMQTIGNWDAFVFQNVSILQTQWEAQVQAQISMIVNSVTTSDHFASVQDYQAYVHNSLQGQASEQLLEWQSAVETEILSERSEYLSALYGSNSGAVASSTAQFQSQWDSFISGSGLNLNLGGALSQAVLNSGQQTLEGLESQWWNDFHNNLQNGLQTYQEALQGLTDKYQSLISQINATEMQYQAHLAQIQQSQAGVKDQILTSLEGYQNFLNGNGLFWNTISVLYDNASNSYVQASCPAGHVCTTYQYDPTNSQFYGAGACPAGHTCANVLYDTTTSSYVQNTVCPSTCNGTEQENLTIRTGLNADGRAFQNVINKVATAMQEGYVMPAIFDYTSGTMLSYNNNCLSGSTCVKGLFDSTSGTFVASNTCSAGHTCYSAVVDNTVPASATGSYFANSCPVGDTRCVTCAAGHSCQVQDMEAGFLYASSLLSTFLHNELLSTQNALQNAVNVQNGASYTYQYGSNGGPLTNNPLTYMQGWWPSPFSHYDQSSNFSTNDVSMWEIFNSGATEGAGGLAQKIMAYVRNEITEMDLSNWIMDAYSSGLGGSGSPLEGLVGLGPGMTITGINQADLRAFMNYVGDPANPNPYCPNPLGCNNVDFFNPGPGIFGANRTYSEGLNSGIDFRAYVARQIYLTPALVPFFLDIQHEQDYAWIELSFTVTNNNAYANVTTYQDLVLQLQAFEHDWQTNVMPSITNWTAQVASYQAQYSNWQTQMQTALSDAQNTFNSGVQDIQSQQSSWLAQMGQLQQQATNAFHSAQSALQNGQGQSNYQQLTQEVLAGLNKGQLKSNLDGDLTVDQSSFKDAFGTILSGLDRNADRGIPNFALLDQIGSGINRITTGISNLSLLSSTNNATMDTILGYMKGIAESLRDEKQFTQNGYSDLIEAAGIKTREVKTKDRITGETISTSYVLNPDGSIATFTENGETKQMTLGDWVAEQCGDDLSKAACSQYVENKYSSVDVAADGKITAHRKVYDGTSSYCGSDAGNSDSYCYGTEDALVTIAAPSKDSFLLGRGASRLGDIFNEREKGFSDLVNATFQNVNGYLSSNKHTALLFTEMNRVQQMSDRNSSLASQDVGNKVKIANLIADYAEAVLLGGMSTSAWVSKQANQAVQDVVATVIARTFDLPPDVASFLAGGLQTHLEVSKAKHDMGSKNLGIGKGIHNFIDAVGMEGLEKAFIKVIPMALVALEGVAPGAGIAASELSESSFKSYENNLAAIDKWKDFKNSMYGFGVQKAAIANGMSPTFAGALAQYTIDYMEMRHAKQELGMRSGAFSLQGLAGNLKLGVASIEGAVGEAIGAAIQSGVHISGDLGLTSEKYEKHINQETREILNDIKFKDFKDDIRNWDSDQAMLASESVKEYGRIHHLDQKTIDLWSQQASDFVVRKQAERDLNKRDGLINLTALTNPVSAIMFLDNKLFGGGITSLVSKGVKGVLTTIADVGNLLGESIVSSDLRDSVYDQTKVWNNTITQQDVKARSQQGIINKAFVETEMRNVLFDVIGEALAGDKDMGHGIGLLLKHHIDQKEAKKAAREQRLKDAEVLAQLAAAAAVTYFGGPAGIQMLNSVLGTGATAINTTLTTIGLSLNNAQVAMIAASTAASMAIENRINGENGAAAALVNGLISTATLGVKTPLTGYVTYTKHQNSNLITGQQEVKGGWGGGVSLNVSGIKGVPAAQALQSILQGMKMSNVTMGLSYNQDAGFGMNVNTNFSNNIGLGLDYNFKSGGYTANASYDVNRAGGKAWANGSVNLSASKDGHASLALSYNHDGNTAIPQRLRGGGATLDLGNDGILGFSIQGLKGATVGNVNYNTNTHGWEKGSLNQNFQNEYLQGVSAESSSYNHEKAQMEILHKEISLGAKMDKPLYTQADIDQYLPKNKDGSIDLENAQPEKLLEKWNAHKEAMSQTSDGVQKWKDEVTRAGEKSGIEIKFNDGKSATSTFGKFVKGLGGDIAQAFGFANDGSKMVDKAGVFHLDTCFVAGTQVHTKDGLKSIETLKIGDVVQSWNEHTGKFEFKPVTELFVHEVPQLFYLELDNEEEIHTTWNHPFRRKTETSNLATTARAVTSLIGSPSERKSAIEEIPLSTDAYASHAHASNSALTSANSEWVKVEDLKVQDQVLKSDGTWARVTGIFHYNTDPTKVYNIEVEDNHTYVVGENVGAVVHNYEGSFDKNVQLARKGLKDLMGGGVLSFLKGEDGIAPQAKDLYNKLENYESQNLKLSSERSKLLTEGAVTQGKKELLAKRNEFLVRVVKDPSANDVEGISDLRRSLKDVNPTLGLNKSQMQAVETWLKKTSGEQGLGGGVGLFKGGMQNVGNNSGIKGLILKAASEAGSSSEVAHLNEKLVLNKEQQRQKALDHEAVGAKLAEVITHDYEQLKVAASEKHYNDANYSDFIAKTQKSGIKLDSPSTYMANEGKKVQAEHQSKLEFIKKYGELDKHGSNGKVVVEQLMNSREGYVNSDLKREDMANRLLVNSPAYQETKTLFDRSVHTVDRLKTDIENRKSQLHAEGKTERQITSDSELKTLNKDYEKATKTRDVAKSEIETLYRNTLSSVDSKSVYGPEIYASALKQAEKNQVYAENLKQISELKHSKENSFGGVFEKVVPGMNLNRETNTKIAELEKRNGEIVDALAKKEMKANDQEANRLGKGGLPELDKTISKTLDAEMRKIVDRNYDAATGLFKEDGPFAHLNNPKVIDEPLQMTNNFNFGDTKEKFQPSPERIQKIAENVISGYTNAPTKDANVKKLSIAEVERIAALPFESPNDRFKRTYGKDYDPNDVDHKIMLAKEMVSARNANQSQFGPLAVQLSATFENIVKQSGGKKENFTPDPSMKPGSKEYKDFEKVREWIFSGKNPMEMGNATSEALCRVFYNYDQALFTKKIGMDTNLATFMTHKIRNGLVSMGVDNPAPVYDNGGTAGYSYSSKPDTRLDNDFGRYLVDKKGNPLGMSGAMNYESVTKIAAELPVGSVLQIFGDTRSPPGPNHYFFAIKGEDGKFRYFNNNSDEKEQKFGERINWKIMKVYGLYYDKK
ncbi:TIGR04388 family protein [Leptospira sp. 201903071]|uniref:TIGR04388 family protein n=1 Tax=Leptospira ainazelensis TaxID=2810034 RepID=UPI001966A166|nr:TIGR04388 family protein [Leptospira ainazelensis]